MDKGKPHYGEEDAGIGPWSRLCWPPAWGLHSRGRVPSSSLGKCDVAGRSLRRGHRAQLHPEAEGSAHLRAQAWRPDPSLPSDVTKLPATYSPFRGRDDGSKGRSDFPLVLKPMGFPSILFILFTNISESP